MSWTYADLKAADPGSGSPGAAAAILNAQTAPSPVQPVKVAAIHGILMLAPTGDWLRIQALAKATPSATAATQPTIQDQAIPAAALALQLADSKVDEIAAVDWPNFKAFVSLLQAAGVVDPTSANKIMALATPTIPKWSPPVTAGDIQTARQQP